MRQSRTSALHAARSDPRTRHAPLAAADGSARLWRRFKLKNSPWRWWSSGTSATPALAAMPGDEKLAWRPATEMQPRSAPAAAKEVFTHLVGPQRDRPERPAVSPI